MRGNPQNKYRTVEQVMKKCIIIYIIVDTNSPENILKISMEEISSVLFILVYNTLYIATQ